MTVRNDYDTMVMYNACSYKQLTRRNFRGVYTFALTASLGVVRSRLCRGAALSGAEIDSESMDRPNSWRDCGRAQKSIPRVVVIGAC